MDMTLNKQGSQMVFKTKEQQRPGGRPRKRGAASCEWSVLVPSHRSAIPHLPHPSAPWYVCGFYYFSSLQAVESGYEPLEKAVIGGLL